MRRHRLHRAVSGNRGRLRRTSVDLGSRRVLTGVVLPEASVEIAAEEDAALVVEAHRIPAAAAIRTEEEAAVIIGSRRAAPDASITLGTL